MVFPSSSIPGVNEHGSNIRRLRSRSTSPKLYLSASPANLDEVSQRARVDVDSVTSQPLAPLIEALDAAAAAQD